MNFQFAHYNYNVIDLDKSIRFYEEALGLKELRRKEAEDGSFILVYLGILGIIWTEELYFGGQLSGKVV